ncbi:serine/threonine-protein kinase [Actinoplanes sp. NPDC024001]|uniref:serine/threonine protein kinase n=1 Tax=Actinoplanes sp. NPDC024001 TaxID=3154598 RepID=UPI003411EDBD
MTGLGQALRSGDPRQVGPYQLIGRLGEGGMGCVYLATDQAGRKVAVKIIRSDLAHQHEFRSRFRSEVERARDVPPFCTAEVLDADPDHETPYLVVEYVDGPSLAAVVAEQGPLTPGNLHGVAIGVATALTAIHGAGVIHRDLKPSNVLLAPGSPKVIDFGIARAVQAADGPTRTDQMVGTVTYMAPERLEPGARHTVTPAADIFAWGAVVAYAGTGRTPFAADMPHIVAVRILTGEPDLDGLAEPLRGLVEQALAKDPAQRPTAREVLDRLLTMTPNRAGSPAAVLDRQPALREAVAEARASTDMHQIHQPPGQATTRFHAHGSVGPVQQPAAEAAGSPMAAEDPQITVRVLPAQRTQPAQPAQPSPPAPPAPVATTYMPHRPKRRSWGRPVIAAVAVLAMLLVAGVAYGNIRLPWESGGNGTTAGPSTEPSAAGAVTPLLVDALTTKGGDWTSESNDTEKATCDIDDGLVVEKLKAGTFRCPGTRRIFSDFAATVKVTLHNPASCAGVWLRFENHDGLPDDGGYLLQICAENTTLLLHGVPQPGDLKKQKTFRHPAPAGPNKPVTVGITAEGKQLTLTRDGDEIGRWDGASYESGRFVLGITGKTSAKPPFRVSFRDLTINPI